MKEVLFMSNLDFGVFMAYLLCILSTILCLAYGIINWNKGKDTEQDDIQEELKWEQKENEINESL